jgi:cell division protein FtsB
MLTKFGRPILIIAMLAAFVSYGTIMFGGPHGLRVLAQKRAVARQLEIENADTQHDIDQKRKRIEKLKNDPSTQEGAVRKVLGYQKPDETLFKSSTALTDQK